MASLGLLRPTRLRDFRELERSQWYSAGELRDLQLRKLNDLLRHVAAHVPHYRPLLAGAPLADPERAPEVLAGMPLVDKRELTAHQGDFLADDHDPSGLLSSHTGGSTGTVFHFRIDRRSKTLRRAIDLRSRQWAGWRPGDPQALLWGHSGDLAAGDSLGGRIRGALFNRTVSLNAFRLGEEQLADCHRTLIATRPVLMIGYASALALLARYITERRLPPPPLRGIISSAETLTDEHRHAVEACFECPVLDRYGSREAGPVAQQCERVGGLHLNAERFWFEVLDPNGRPCPPGERGEIVLTDLDARGMPFLRYRTGDLAVPSDDVCGCGRGLPLIDRVEGRVTDVLVGENGRIIICPGPTFFLAGRRTVTQMQIEQRSLDEILLRIVPGPGWDEREREGLAARIRDLLGNVRVDFEESEDIPKTPSGKYRFVISDVSPFRVS